MYNEADLFFGSRMREKRRERKMTQEQLSEAVGISVTYCRSIEKGKYTPSWRIWLRICGQLGLDPNDFRDVCLSRTTDSSAAR